MLYFAVDMWLSQYLFALFAGGLLRWIILGPRVEGSTFPLPKPNLNFPTSNLLSGFRGVFGPVESFRAAPGSVKGKSISEYSGPIPSALFAFPIRPPPKLNMLFRFRAFPDPTVPPPRAPSPAL